MANISPFNAIYHAILSAIPLKLRTADEDLVLCLRHVWRRVSGAPKVINNRGFHGKF